MKDKKPLEQAIKLLESHIKELRDSLSDWDNLSVNRSGATVYKEKAKRIVLEAKSIESRINEPWWRTPSVLQKRLSIQQF